MRVFLGLLKVFGGHLRAPQVDIFAAGVLLYFMLRGRLPFSGESHSAVLELLASIDLYYALHSII